MTTAPGDLANDEFVVALDRLAATWIALRRDDQEAAAELLGRALDHGIDTVAHELVAVAEPVPGFQRRRVEVALVRAAGALSPRGYLDHYAPAVEPGTDAFDHYCRRGWRSMANPSLEFDTWWYRFTYLALDERRINPLVHHLLHGRHHGTLPRPPVAPDLAPATAPGRSPRRVCLFAAYDLDGIVDDYVVAYLRDLSRFADVYYLADGHVPDDELAKLAPYTLAAWSRPHGAYDFGSLAILAEELVGWDVIDGYDELLLANDSSYLLRPLDEVFARMDAQDCDWWGMQSTKRDLERAPEPLGPSPVLDDAAVRRMVGQPEWQQVDQLHVSSYLLCLRRPAFLEPDVRRLLASVRPEKAKSQVILKYEIGLSRVLLDTGHRFATFIEGLYPYHPLYTSDYFELLAQGFPFLKRNFVAENARDAPGLSRWKERVAAIVPDADVGMFERNLLRVSADDRLQRSFAVDVLPDGSLSVPLQLDDDEIAELDARTPTYDHWWAFPVCAYDHTFAGNERAVFEQVRDDPAIKKVVLTRSRRIDVTGENVVVLPLTSAEGVEHAVRSRFVFVKHAPTVNVPYPLDPDRHDFVNLWHGIPLKRFGTASLEKDPRVVAEHLRCRGVITSSAVDTLAMTSAFYPLTTAHMWQTGLPRNDFVVRPTADLPPDLAAQRTRLLDELAGRRLVMFLPTFKKDQADAYYNFSEDDLAWLADWSRRHDAVLGLREHMADRARTYSSLLGPLDPVNLSSRRFPDLEVLYAAADGLVSDYSSCLVDFMLTGKPVISFAYDLDRYASEERGLFYDLDQVLPGPVCRDFGELAVALDEVFADRDVAQLEEYDWKRRLFFEHLDDGNARRVVSRVRELALSEPGS